MAQKKTEVGLLFSGVNGNTRRVRHRDTPILDKNKILEAARACGDAYHDEIQDVLNE